MLWVGQFGVEEGEAKEHTPWVGAFPDHGKTEDPSDVYVIVEPALPGSEEFCGDLKNAIGDNFHKKKVSLTGGLLRALEMAHENLREWNRKSIKDHRVAAGVSCLAIHQREAYLAQVAPASAVLYRAGSVFPVAPRIPDANEPLGLFDEFRPDFWRFELEEDDRILILSPGLAEKLTEADLSEALAMPAEDALPDLYRKARGIENCAALLVVALPEEPEPA
jgi:serine/threonine protein phosphatase PrpC